jgi:crotonobetainyl-CoA:carnitine CoA-transferase CaiB-like acyl-CoA transferase
MPRPKMVDEAAAATTSAVRKQEGDLAATASSLAPLRGTTIHERGVSVPVRYSTALLGRLGANVVCIEVAGARAEPEALSAVLRTGKRVLSPGVPIPLAEVLIADAGSPAPEATSVVVTLALPARSDDGSTAENVEAALLAQSGISSAGAPAAHAGYRASYLVGAHVASAAIAGLLQFRLTRVPVRIEVAALDVLAGVIASAPRRWWSPDRGREWPPARPWIVPVADGFVVINLAAPYISDFLGFAEAEGLVEPGNADGAERCARAAEGLALWTRSSFLERARLWRLPVGAVKRVDELIGDPQLHHRSALVDIDDPKLGHHSIPWLPWLATDEAV